MRQSASDNKLSDQGARAIHETFIAYRTRFMQITRRAQSRFIDRDWQAMRTDATRRLELYREAVRVLIRTWNVEGFEPMDESESLAQLSYVACSMMNEG